MYGWFLIGVTIFVLLVILYYAARQYEDRQIENLDASNGTFDDVAKTAYKAAKKKIARDPADVDAQFAVGRISRYNINEGAEAPVDVMGEAATAYTEVVRRPDEMTDFMIDEVETLYNLTIFGGEDRDTTNRFAAFQTAATVGIPEARQKSIERRKHAAATAATKADAIEKFLDASQTHTNDAQNVHDTKVNDDLRDTLARLPRVDNTMLAVNDAKTWAQSKGHNNALKTLAMIEQRNKITSFNTTEDDIFARVWRRCEDPLNADSRDNMREAVMTALDDCNENGALVCTTGRCNRVLGSLVLLDHDPKVGRAMTLESYKNEIFQTVSKMIDTEIAAGVTAGNATAIAWTSGAAADPDDESAFRGAIERKVDTYVDTFADKLDTKTLDRLKEECHICIA